MDNDTSQSQTSPGTQPASNTPGEGSPAEAQTHQDGPTGLSAVSDSVALLSGVASAYEGFDPTIHATKDGKPVLLKGGGLARKRGRRAGSPAVTSATAAPGATPAPGTAKMSNDVAAKIICTNAEAFFIALFGMEWEVTDKTEMIEIHKGVKTYLESTGGIDVSPAWGLVFTAGGYAVPRLKLPETRSRLSRAFSWIKSKLKRGE